MIVNMTIRWIYGVTLKEGNKSALNRELMGLEAFNMMLQKG